VVLLVWEQELAASGTVDVEVGAAGGAVLVFCFYKFFKSSNFGPCSLFRIF
jgi:hypothetical protein